MIEAVLFDLDGTLLDIDIDVFLHDYFGALGPAIARLTGDGDNPRVALDAVLAATGAMQTDHPGRTNMDVFAEHFLSLTGVDLGASPAADAISDFYSDVFPQLRGALGPRDGALEAVEAARALGLKVAVATNPIFPIAAISERMRWVGLSETDVDFVTSYEVSTSCKPSPSYFLETAAALGIDAHSCVMVGDDRGLDMPASTVGMRTFYVGAPPLPEADWHGSLGDLAQLLPRLVS